MVISLSIAIVSVASAVSALAVVFAIMGAAETIQASDLDEQPIQQSDSLEQTLDRKLEELGAIFPHVR